MKNLILPFLLLSFQLLAHTPEQESIITLDLESVIEGDTRDLVRDHRDPVTKSVGLLAYGNSFCTATLITTRHILTNGHCVTDMAKLPFAFRSPKIYKFYPGKLSVNDVSNGVYSAVRIDSFSRWIKNGDQDYDVAVIKLDRAVTGIAPMRIKYQPIVEQFSNFALYINGYSAGKAYGTQWEGTGFFQRRSGNNSFLHDIDTMGGTSGGMVRKREGSQWVGIGVHRGSQNNPREGGLLNRAIFFNHVIYTNIVNWTKN